MTRFIKLVACHYIKMKVNVTIITPLHSEAFYINECGSDFKGDEMLKYITVMDNTDLVKAIIRESKQHGIIIIDDIVYYYRENPLDDVNTRILTFILALLKEYSEKGLVIASSEPSGMEENNVSAFKVIRFWADCVCEVEEESPSVFILKLVWTKNDVGGRIRVSFKKDGGLVWETA